jgi:hypothetical protein
MGSVIPVIFPFLLPADQRKLLHFQATGLISTPSRIVMIFIHFSAQAVAQKPGHFGTEYLSFPQFLLAWLH